jgi:hypothetical protein
MEEKGGEFKGNGRKIDNGGGNSIMMGGWIEDDHVNGIIGQVKEGEACGQEKRAKERK